MIPNKRSISKNPLPTKCREIYNDQIKWGRRQVSFGAFFCFSQSSNQRFRQNFVLEQPKGPRMLFPFLQNEP